MQQILAFADKLLDEYLTVLQLSGSGDRADEAEFDRCFTRWRLSAKKVLEYAGLDSFLADYQVIEEEKCHPARTLPYLAGILQSARECLENGFTGKLRHLLHAEMFNSLVEQAKELLDTGHNIPAAVLCRIVIERWLRDQAEKAGVPNWDKAKASVINDALRNAGVFTTPKWRHVQGLLDVGNAAAHGDEKEFTEADVRRMIDFAEANCM